MLSKTTKLTPLPPSLPEKLSLLAWKKLILHQPPMMMMMIRKIQRREMINQSSMKLSLKLKKKSPKPRLRSRLLKMLSILTIQIPQRIMMILMQLKERN
jgi:hypothetical protein